MTVEVRPYRSDDLEEVAAIRREAFRGSTRTEDWEQGGWVLTDRGCVQAIALIERAGQFFGGRSVPCAQMRSVAVVPWARGRGWSRLLLTEILRALHQDGIILSTLYPTHLAPYRRVGYEIAGSRTRYRRAIASLPDSGLVSVEPLTSALLSEVQACYRRYATGNDGLLDRPAYWWRRLLAGSEERPVHGVVVRGEQGLSGYLLYTQEEERGWAAGGPASPLAVLGLAYAVHCRDLVWNDRDGALTLLGHLRANVGLGTDLFWFGPSPEPLAMLTGLQDTVSVHTTEIWMSRLINVEAALRARGYSPAVGGSLSVEVGDSLIPENSRCLRLEWTGGAIEVEAVPRAGMRIDVGTLASVFSGRLPARDAARLGGLTGALERDIALLEAAFAGRQPWLADIF